MSLSEDDDDDGGGGSAAGFGGGPGTLSLSSLASAPLEDFTASLSLEGSQDFEAPSFDIAVAEVVAELRAAWARRRAASGARSAVQGRRHW